AAIVPPRTGRPIHTPGDVTRMKVAFENVDLSQPDLQGAGQTVSGNEVEVTGAFGGPAEPEPGDLAPYTRPELFIESDAPELVEEARKAVGTAAGASLKAERLVRHVNALLEKKPTVSLPSAREVFRTGVGDCNEHTVLYVALARAAGVPARIAVGLVFLRGAFYYHAWPEVYLDDAKGGPRWAAVDPTLNQFPADATHVRLARGGLDRQTVILSLIGRAKARIVSYDVPAGTTPVLVGNPQSRSPMLVDLPRKEKGGCWSQPAR
ncbi:MAG TPA: transglutaminase-like domain-containing protein, partial [Vicinamibacteria bacterium]|nr:transglutaminase-like domain-containing protein [Vicinamibacteria bacterium]